MHLSGQESGLPFHRNYSSGEYNGATQNWAIVQDHRGIIYAGNDEGVLQYDGVNWRKISIANLSGIRSLGIDSNGVVYVGAFGEFGFLKPDETGKLHYMDLTHLVDSADRDFMDVWTAIPHKTGVYFLTERNIFIYRDDSIQTLKPSGSSFFLAYKVGDEIFVSEYGKGLSNLKNDSIKLLPRGEVLVNFGPFCFVPYDENAYYLGHPGLGLLSYDLNKQDPDRYFSYVQTDGNDYLKNYQVYSGVQINDQQLAFGTTQKGIAILDQQANLKETFHYENVLMDESVYELFLKKNNPLFAAMDNGLARIEVTSPFRYWDNSTGFRGTILDIIRFKGKIHVATVHGVYIMDNDPCPDQGVNKFTKVRGLLSQTWKFLDFETENQHFLFAGSDDGIFQIENDSAIRMSEYTGGFTLYQSETMPDRIFAGTRDRLNTLSYKNGEFIEQIYEQDFLQNEFRSIAEDTAGNMWLSANYEGIYKVNWNNEQPLLAKYDTSHGLPSLKEIAIFNLDNKIRFGTRHGLYVYDNKGDTIVPDMTFGEAFARAGIAVNRLYKDNKGNYFIGGKHRFIQQADNSYAWDSISFKRIPLKYAESSYIDTNDFYWAGGSEGLYRFNPDIKKNYNYVQKLKTLIRQVAVGDDSVLFKGFYFDKTKTYQRDEVIPLIEDQTDDFIPEIDFAAGSIILYYALPFFEDENANLYSHYLEGFDPEQSGWSEWSSESKKEYTNLSEGKYVFHVKGKNIYGMESQESSFAFRILPPWYRTWYAYVVYLLVLAVMISIIIRMRTARLKQEKQKLEGVVLERTAEIQSQKEELETQAEWLQNANQNMLEQKHEILFQAERLKKSNEELEKANSTKDTFFSIIAHDLRSPFASFVSLTDVMVDNLKDFSDDEIMTYMKEMRESSQKTYNLIENLLDWARTQRGDIKYDPQELNVQSLVHENVELFHQLADQKDISLENEIPEKAVIHADENMVKTIFRNLVSNAIKFTNEKGKVTLSAKEDGDYWQFTIEDNGIGIEKENLSKLFEIDTRHTTLGTKQEKGTGLGLILCKEFVERNSGKIRVESEKGKGTTFFFTLPKPE